MKSAKKILDRGKNRIAKSIRVLTLINFIIETSNRLIDTFWDG